MRTHWDLFCMPGNVGSAYCTAVEDVRQEMEKLVLKHTPKDRTDDWKAGWNAALVALSKKIRIEKGKRGP